MTNVVDVISQMRKLNGTLPKREQRVADFILDNLEDITFLKQNEIAQAAEVSDATVNRFCVSLGYQGFRDFKLRLAQSVAVNLQYIGETGDDGSEAGPMVGQVFGALVRTLNLAQSQLDTETIEQAVEVIAGSKRIVFIGVGDGSANVAREGANRFFRLGIPAEAHADGYFQRMLASTLGEDDILFAISSSSGQPVELLDSIAIAKEYGAKTISLTKPGSDLERMSDICVAVNLPEDQDIYKPSASRLVFMAIIDILAAGVARRKPENVRESLRRIRMSLVSLSEDTDPKPIGD